ncbi:MAG: hypothetical protein U5K55_04845 [Aliarcobacter sp.]|nr:hypothetical protein [Aliarcobacter sp.]
MKEKEENAIFFAQNGFEVDAIDASDIGLSKLDSRSKEENFKDKTFLHGFKSLGSQ